MTVQYGEQGIPASSTFVHKVNLVKKENHITMTIDGREIINWKDDEINMAPYFKKANLHFDKYNGHILDIEISKFGTLN